MKKVLFLLLSILIISGCAEFKRTNLPTGRQVDLNTGNYWVSDYSEISGLNYVITFPKPYENDTNKNWPVILFLHGLEERGDNIRVVIEHTNGEGKGLAFFALTNNQFPFITISPLCPKGSYWPLMNGRLSALLKDVTIKYRINLNQIYLTGVSMGGMGVWSLSMQYPDWFAAIAPISGGIYFPMMIENVQALKNVPVWAFHDRFDSNVTISSEENTIKRLKENGSSVQYTISETCKHYIQEKIYSKGDLFKWFLENERK